MKKLIILLFLLQSISTNLFSQTIKTVGSGANYSRLKLAFDAINSGTIQGDIILQIVNNATESVSAVLHESGYNGTANYTSVTIYPTVAGKSITGNLAGTLIELHGADNVTFDGRVNQAGSADLIITNTNTGASSSTVRFIDDATSNLINYCIIKGSESGSTSGVIFFSTTTGSNGNDNNTLDHNNITYAGTSRPVYTIFSSGTSGQENSGNIISNNNFFDFLNYGIASSAILLSSNTTTWTISGNSFYETASLTPTADVPYNAIQIDNPSGTGFNITGNNIGGSSVSCGGTPWTKTIDFDNPFNAINLNTGTGTTSQVQNNTIKNFDWSNSLSSSWTGILIAGGDINVGTSSGNNIGSGTGTGSISISNAQPGSFSYGINILGSGVVDCQNNIIGSITTTNSDNANENDFYGINKDAVPGTTTISNNTIGSTTTPNSIFASSLSTGNAQSVYGIANAGNDNITIENNTIANLTNGTSNSDTGSEGLINGIKSTSGTTIVSNNTIRDLTISNANTSTGNTASVCGIALTGSTLKTITGNIIYNLKNTYSSFAGNIIGLYFTGNTGANAVRENFIHSLSVTGAASTSASVYGIRISSGAATYSNNIINLGGNTQTNIYGIYETGAAGNNNNLYFNSVYINGNPTAGSANSFALFSTVTTNTRNFRNNVLFNARSNSGATGTHYSVYITSAGGIITTDHNDYYASGTGGVLGFLAGNVLTLPAWKTATGQDANSLSTDPIFINAGGSTPDDYLQTVFLGGVTGTGITTDFNGALRGASPTMGAFQSGSCSNPTSGGTITAAQIGCMPFDPVPFNSTLPASGYSGTFLEYKWQQSTTGSSGVYSDIPGTNSTTYNPGSLSQTTWFKRLASVSCAGWTGAAESNILMVTVNPTPNTGLTVSGAGSVCSGSGTNITVALSESGVNYQLRNGTLNIGSALPGNGGTISFPTGNLIITTTFNVLATNASTGCSAQLTQTALVTVNPLPNKSLVVGGGGQVCSGSGTNITVALSESGVNYQLRNGVVTIGAAVPGTGATINLPTGSMTFNINFNVLAVNASSSCSAQLTQTALVSVNPLPNTSLTVGGAGSVCSGTGTNITVALSQIGVNYQLRNGVVNVGSIVAGNGGTINLPTGNLIATTTFNVYAAYASTGCSAQLTQTPVVTVNQLPNSGLAVGGSGSVCTGSGTNITVSLSEIGVNYQLRNGVINIGSAVAGNGGTINLPTGNLVATTTFNVLATNSATSCSAQLTQTVAVTVNPLPNISLVVGGTGSVCSGSGTNITVALSEAGVNYQLRIGVVNIGIEVPGNGGTISLPTGNLVTPSAFNVLATNAVTSCSAVLTETETISIDLLSVGGTVSGTTPVTYGSSTGTMTLTGYTGVIQRWEKRFNTGSWSTISNSAPTYSETPSSAGTWGYRAVVKSGSCTEANSTEFSVTVDKAPLSITAADKNKVYDGLTFSPFTVTFSGFVNGETSVVLGGTLTFSGTATTSTNSGTYVITPGGLTSTNYTITNINGQLIIDKAPLSITAADKNKVYDGLVFSPFTATYSGFVNGETSIVLGGSLSYTGTASTGTIPGSYVITPGGLTSVNYTLAFIDGQLTITKANLTFTADNKSKVFQQANPLLTYTISGFVNGEIQSVLEVLPSIQTTALLNSPVGSYPITLSGGNDNCYNYVFVEGTLTITRMLQTISFTDIPEKLLVGDSYTLAATSTSGLTILFESLDIDVATIAGSILTGVSKGKARIRAYNTGDISYEPAEVIDTVEVYSTHKDIMYLFTPNGDGINDYWELPELATWGKCDVKLYNRWGKLVFADADYNNLWNGTSNGNPVPEGAYYFVIKTENEGVVKGTVNIVR